MCFSDPGLIIGAVSAAAGEAGKMSAASTNADIAVQQARLEHSSQAREFLISADAANKDAFKAAQERDRAVSDAKVEGVDMQGSTMGARVSEQNRQGALSIANAKDQLDAARGNYVMAGHNSSIKAANDIRVNAVNPLTSFMNIAKGGMDGYGTIKSNATPSATKNYSAFS
jgi:hypothetical protein